MSHRETAVLIAKNLLIDAKKEIEKEIERLADTEGIEFSQLNGKAYDAKILLKIALLNYADRMSMTKSMDKKVRDLRKF